MKKLILLLLFIPLVSIGQSQEPPFFLNYTSQDAIKSFNALKARAESSSDGPKFKTNITKNSFEWSLDFGEYSRTRVTTYTYGFNDNGNVTYIQQYRPDQWADKSIDQIYDEECLKLREYDNNPKKSNKSLKYKGVFLKDPINFRLQQYDQNVTVTIAKHIVPQYNRRGTKIIGYNGGVVYRSYPDKVSNVNKVNTNFGDLFDLRDEDMIYNIKNYMTAFLLHITSPEMFIGNVYLDDIVRDPKNAVKNSNKWKLNATDKHLLEKFSTNHKFNCEFNLEQTAKYGHPNDKSKENQIVCPSDFISYEMKVEYRDLEDNVIAVAIGNVFNNEIMHVVIDPIKFKEASPAKRAFIMWHELFHTVGLDHGECGPLMFPYTDKDYTWEDWEASNGEAMKCFISKRNALQGIY
jgi:hypothetical protein